MFSCNLLIKPVWRYFTSLSGKLYDDYKVEKFDRKNGIGKVWWWVRTDVTGVLQKFLHTFGRWLALGLDTPELEICYQLLTKQIRKDKDTRQIQRQNERTTSHLVSAVHSIPMNCSTAFALVDCSVGEVFCCNCFSFGNEHKYGIIRIACALVGFSDVCEIFLCWKCNLKFCKKLI